MGEETAFKCQKCGHCCRNITINIAHSDIMRWVREKRYDILDKISYLDNEEVGKGFYIEETLKKKDRKNLPCPFLENNMCSVYETRPRACADFPDGHSTWKECPAWRKIGLVYDEVRSAKVSRSQKEDFALADEKRFLLLHYLTLARDRNEEAIDRLLDPLDPDETLWVTGYDATAQWTTTSGSTPWLDDTASYIESAVKKADSQNYEFANTSYSSNTLETVYLYLQGQDAAGTITDIYLWDGAAWVGVPFQVDFDAVLGYKSVDVSTFIDSWTKVDACELHVEHENNEITTRVYRAYLFCSYTEVGPTTQQCDEGITVTEYIANSMTNIFTETATLFSDMTSGLISYLYRLESITLTHYLRYLSNWSRYPVDAISLVTDVDTTWSAYNSLIESVTLTSYLDYILSVYLNVFQSITMYGFSSYVYSMLRSESSNIVGYLSSTWTASIFNTDTLDITGYLEITTSVLLGLLQAVNLTDYFTRLSSWYYTVSQPVTLLDILSSSWITYQSMINTLDIAHYWSYDISGILSQSLIEITNITDYITWYSTTVRVVIESLTLSGVIAFSITKLYDDAFTMVSALDYASPWKRALLENPSISDFWNMSTTITRLYTEQVTLLDSFSSSLGELIKSFIEAVNVSHYIKFGIEQRFYNTLSIADSITKGIVELVTRFIRLRFIGDD